MSDDAKAVVIGAGAFGCSIAYHLASLGCSPVMLLDKHGIASQTSPRAAGLLAPMHGSDVVVELGKRSLQKIRRFTSETGQPLDYHVTGSLKIARSKRFQHQLFNEIERGRRLGIDVAFISAAQAQRRLPIFEPVGVHAITYSSGDAYLEPKDLVRGYAEAAAALGVYVLPDTAVERIDVEHGMVRGLDTTRGFIGACVVVDAAGAWARVVGEPTGSSIAVVPTRHQLLITEPIAEVEDSFPIARVVDSNVYVRPASGGIMLGGYEPAPLQYDMNSLHSDFSIDDLPLDIATLDALLGKVGDIFPVLKERQVRELRGGLPTMTADGELIVGPVSNIAGMFVATGCCVGGLSVSPAIGEWVASAIMSRPHPLDLQMRSLAPSRPLAASQVTDAILEAARNRYASHYWAEE